MEDFLGTQIPSENGEVESRVGGISNTCQYRFRDLGELQKMPLSTRQTLTEHLLNRCQIS